MNRIKQTAAMLLALLLLTALPVRAQAPAPAETPLEQAAAWVAAATPAPVSGSTGGEWAVIGLARCGALTQTARDAYLRNLETRLRNSGGVLHARKYTEYSRAVLAVTAVGGDPEQIGGYSLLEPLRDYDRTVRQGVNGAVWALLALDSRSYAAPEGLRQRYVEAVLSARQPDGGWGLLSTASDPDTTAMALQALSPYREQERVQAAVDGGLGFLSTAQQPDGGFGSAESAAQAVTALCTLGIPLEDARFVKNGHTALDGLLALRLPEGSFCHQSGGKANAMASEQALCALTAAHRAALGQTGLYVMTQPTETNPAAVPSAAASASGTAQAGEDSLCTS